MLDGQADSADVRRQLDRIMKSAALAGAARLQELLLYTVEEVLAGRGAELKETVIGAEVFDRTSHDPRLDSIVRVTCSKLRAKLREYYLTEGINDPVEIEFPKGGYAPILKRRLPEPVLEEPGEPKPDEAPAVSAPVVETKTRPNVWPWVALAGVVVAVAIAVVVFLPKSRPRSQDPIRFQVAPPASLSFRPLANGGRILVSPDGKKFAAAAMEGNSFRILIRRFESRDASVFPADSRVILLAWSPDSRSLAFGSENKLWRMDTTNGSVLEIAEVGVVLSAAWGRDGQITYSAGGTGGLFQVSLNGGKPTRLTEIDPKSGEVQHAHPVFLGDGENLLYAALNADESQSTVYIAPLRNLSKRTALTKAHSNIGLLELSDGRSNLVFMKGHALVAHPFNVRSKALFGEPFVLEPNVGYYPFHSVADFSAAADGLVYRAANANSPRKLLVLDRSGKTIAESPSAGIDRFPRFSPDGKNIAVERLPLDSMSGNLWLASVDKLNVANRITSEPAGSYGPIWSPDSQSILYATRRVQGPGLYRRSLRDGHEQQISNTLGTPTSYSPDGKWVFFHQQDPKTSYDLWIVHADGSAPPSVYRKTRFDEIEAQFSPDGQWLTYSSNESGSSEVFVERFLPGNSNPPRVQIARGYSPYWTNNGDELVFSDGASMMSVQRVSRDGVRFTEPKALFQCTGLFHRGFGYHASADGQRFVFSVAAADKQPADNQDIGVLLWK